MYFLLIVHPFMMVVDFIVIGVCVSEVSCVGENGSDSQVCGGCCAVGGCATNDNGDDYGSAVGGCDSGDDNDDGYDSGLTAMAFGGR